jgi:hypothetical protein
VHVAVIRSGSDSKIEEHRKYLFASARIRKLHPHKCGLIGNLPFNFACQFLAVMLIRGMLLSV